MTPRPIWPPLGAEPQLPTAVTGRRSGRQTETGQTGRHNVWCKSRRAPARPARNRQTSGYDVIVLGGAHRASTARELADGGLRVALAEHQLVGGECSDYACIPSNWPFAAEWAAGGEQNICYRMEPALAEISRAIGQHSAQPAE
jgi:hypothetical protein